jgi:hypothetical protein
MSQRFVLASLVFAVCVVAAEKYTGPVPPKPDVPYLLHAANLVETEAAQAQQGKKGDTFIISGASSPARTPLAEPVFILDARQIQPEGIELYRLDVKGGNREVNLAGSRRRGSHALHLAVKPLGGHLYRIEADEPLEDGEYALSPNGDNRAFCFEIYGTLAICGNSGRQGLRACAADSGFDSSP